MRRSEFAFAQSLCDHLTHLRNVMIRKAFLSGNDGGSRWSSCLWRRGLTTGNRRLEIIDIVFCDAAIVACTLHLCNVDAFFLRQFFCERRSFDASVGGLILAV